jgi:hypothetical protein
MSTTWGGLWWRVRLLARIEMRRARGAWLVWRRHHRKPRRVRPIYRQFGAGITITDVHFSANALSNASLRLGAMNGMADRQQQLQAMMAGAWQSPHSHLVQQQAMLSQQQYGHGQLGNPQGVRSALGGLLGMIGRP